MPRTDSRSPLQTRVLEQTCPELIQEARQAEKDTIPRLVHGAVRNMWHTEELNSQNGLNMVKEKTNHLQLSVNQCLNNHGGGHSKGNQKKPGSESPLAQQSLAAPTCPSNSERIVALETENLEVFDIHEPILSAGHSPSCPCCRIGWSPLSHADLEGSAVAHRHCTVRCAE